VTYVRVTPEKVARIVEEHVVNGRPVLEYVIGAEGKA
jgi:NADP-reducing hydrogenase subunit HndB